MIIASSGSIWYMIQAETATIRAAIQKRKANFHSFFDCINMKCYPF